MKRKIQIVVLLFILTNSLKSEIATNWITNSTNSTNQYGVYLFRKSYIFNDVPDNLILKVSADNKYILYVNGNKVCNGSTKGDLMTYKYDLVDVAPYLHKGKNVFAAQVFNGGTDRPLAFVSQQTAFFIQSVDSAYQIRTDKTWKTFRNKAYRSIDYKKLLHPAWFYGFYASGAGDDVAMKYYPEGWELPGFDDKKWRNAVEIDSLTCQNWNLFPSPLPSMDNHIVAPLKIREAINANLSGSLSENNMKIVIPANRKVSILYDFEDMTYGYPELLVSKGKGSVIKIKYAESLYDSVNYKAHRDSVTGKKMYGVWDIFRPNGALKSVFRPLWTRSFRYVKLEISTKSKPLEITGFTNENAGYPYPNTSTFNCNNQQLNEIFDMSLRTFKLSSSDTYFDTPYYEQLNYGGDNVPIGAISFYNSTDDRLYKEMLRLYPQSVNPQTGLFKSAYPSRFDFDMGTWSLAWIQSLNDYYSMRSDSVFVKQYTTSIEQILDYFKQHFKESSMLLEHVQSKNFVDWSAKSGSLPHKDGNEEFHQSVLLTLYYAYTLDCTVNLYRNIGENAKALKWELLSSKIKNAVNEKYRDEKSGLFREYPGKDEFTQHTNILAILCNVVPLEQQNEMLNKILTYDKFDEKVSSYFSYFLFKAMEKTGRADLILSNLYFWDLFIAKGLRTCGESGFASMDRSDCHAWSAHPAYFFLSCICGIKPGSIGFKTVSIEPHLGNLTQVNASMPHPLGKIIVEYTIENKILRANIQLPENLNGVWKYNGNEIKLHSGLNSINASVLF